VKLAFVVPWYGAQASGGAETAVRNTAEALYHQGGLDVEVLTTCSREFNGDWSENALPAGLDAVNDVPVRRFPVRPRDAQAFDRINAKLMQNEPISAAEEAIFMREMIHSDALCDFIRERIGQYFLFFTPYMFGTTYAGSAIDPDRSALIPALHDESYAYLGIYAGMFRRVRGVMFYSRAEMELGRRLYTMRLGAPMLAPLGVTADFEGDGARFRARHRLGNYLLYVGRKEPGKNLPLLLDYFRRYRERGGAIKLVLLGKGPVTVPPDLAGDVLDLGFVPDWDKWDAYDGAMALCQPSLHESFSLVLMEAWLSGTPSLVHAGCPVTVEHSLESNGGLFFHDYAEFAAAVDLLSQRPELREALGRQGREYVRRHFSWEAVIARYLDALRRWGVEPERLRRPGAPAARRRQAVRAVRQLLSGFRDGDAISNHAVALDETFRSWGLESQIFAVDAAKEVEDRCDDLNAFLQVTQPDDLVVYHHSIYSAATDAYLQTPARRVMIYHNITPARYFVGASRVHEELCRRGRAWLPELIHASDLLLADSTFNAEELRQLGAANCQVVPLLLNLDRLEATPADESVLARYGDGWTNLLFVGRIVRNKRQDEIIEVLRRYRRLNPWVRLVLVGGRDDDQGGYAEELRDQIRQAALGATVELTGQVSDGSLHAYYRCAHVFVCMSEHEGFCVPIIEAMRFGVPVAAYAAAAVPETMGGAGVLIQEKDYEAIAAVVDRLVRDTEFRREIVAGQRRRLEDLAPKTVAEALRLRLDHLLR